MINSKMACHIHVLSLETSPFYYIGIGRFLKFGGLRCRILGGTRYRICGGQGVAKLFSGCKLIRAPAPNQCHIITFLTMKTDNIAKLRIELKSILLEIPLNKIKGTYSRTSMAQTPLGP